MNNTQNNGRSEERYPIAMKAMIIGAKDDSYKRIEKRKQQSTTLNVSLSGCLLMTTSPVKESKIWIQLNDERNSIIECNVVRQLESTITSSFCYGLNFQGVITQKKFENALELSAIGQVV